MNGDGRLDALLLFAGGMELYLQRRSQKFVHRPLATFDRAPSVHMCHLPLTEGHRFTVYVGTGAHLLAYKPRFSQTSNQPLLNVTM